MVSCAETNRSTFKQLAYPHMKLLFNVALRYTGNVFDAEDIVQETYLMAYNKFHQLKDNAKIKAWLLRILRNNFLKNCQKRTARLRLQEADYIEFLKNRIPSQDAEELLVDESATRFVHRAVEQLPPKYKEVLTLYYMNEMLYKDIAKTLNIPIGTVMSRLTRARGALKTTLVKNLNPGRNTGVNTRGPREARSLGV